MSCRHTKSEDKGKDQKLPVQVSKRPNALQKLFGKLETTQHNKKSMCKCSTTTPKTFTGMLSEIALFPALVHPPSTSHAQARVEGPVRSDPRRCKDRSFLNHLGNLITQKRRRRFSKWLHGYASLLPGHEEHDDGLRMRGEPLWRVLCQLTGSISSFVQIDSGSLQDDEIVRVTVRTSAASKAFMVSKKSVRIRGKSRTKAQDGIVLCANGYV